MLLFLVRGVSFAPADTNYAGLGPFSEVETRAISNYIDSIGAKLAGLLSFRGFGQRLLLPFAHTMSHMYNYNETVSIEIIFILQRKIHKVCYLIEINNFKLWQFFVSILARNLNYIRNRINNELHKMRIMFYEIK